MNDIKKSSCPDIMQCMSVYVFYYIKNIIKLTSYFVKGFNEALEFLQWMLEKGFDMSILNRDEESILMALLSSRYRCHGDQHKATDEKVATIVHFLAKNNVRFIKNKHKDSPLHKAAEAGYARTIDVLIEYGVDVCDRNEIGYTPLHSCLLLPPGK